MTTPFRRQRDVWRDGDLEASLPGSGSGYGYLQASFRNQASNRDLSALLTSFVPPGFEDDARVKPFDDDDDTGSFEASPGTWLANHQSGYGFDAQVPLSPLDANGTPATQLRFSHLTTISSQSVDGPGASPSSYLYNQRDAQNDDWLEIDHHFSKSDLSFKYDILTESLDTQYVAGIAIDEAIPAPGAALTGARDKPSSGIYQIPLSQTQRTAALRYTLDPNEYLHFAAAAYLSDFSTFGIELLIRGSALRGRGLEIRRFAPRSARHFRPHSLRS